MFTTQGQFLELLAGIFGGIVIGIIYDVLHFYLYREIAPAESRKKEKKLTVIISDILFVILAAVVFLVVTYLADFGDIRLFDIAGFAVGFVAERFSIKIIVAKAVSAVYNKIIKIKEKWRARRELRKAKKKPRKRKNDRISV